MCAHPDSVEISVWLHSSMAETRWVLSFITKPSETKHLHEWGIFIHWKCFQAAKRNMIFKHVLFWSHFWKRMPSLEDYDVSWILDSAEILLLFKCVVTFILGEFSREKSAILKGEPYAIGNVRLNEIFPPLILHIVLVTRIHQNCLVSK